MLAVAACDHGQPKVRVSFEALSDNGFGRAVAIVREHFDALRDARVLAVALRTGPLPVQFMLASNR